MGDVQDHLPCTGASVCDAPVHVHGCYADLGNCDSPEEHRPPVDELIDAVQHQHRPQNCAICGGFLPDGDEVRCSRCGAEVERA